MAKTFTMEDVVNLSKNRGFVFPGSEIYGGLANTWDYGPVGVELKKNIKDAWWKKFVQENAYNVGLDAAILMNPKTWEASGHIGGFNDPLMDCRSCKSRFRADHLIEEYLKDKGEPAVVDGWNNEKMEEFIKEHNIPCPDCKKHDFTEIREFNLMFKTYQGVTDESQQEIYMRPETAQGIFVNFKNVQRTSRKKLPFGIGQIGKAFRNEITPGNFIFRTREFEQMELQFFCTKDDSPKWFDYWRAFCKDWVVKLGVAKNSLRMRDHEKDELSHYSNATTDIEYKFPFGWGEIWGIADRSNYDLTQHIEHSGENLYYRDPQTGEQFIPYVVEPSVGVDRLFLMFLCEAMDEEELNNGDTRTVLRFHPALAPFKAAILPLSKKLSDKANDVYERLRADFMVDYDESGSIGRRYRRQDEIGTPFCITVDFDTLDDNEVTVRYRDSMEQIRIPIEDVKGFLAENIKF
ncbi:MAG: glycine--tRNA ligase [Clostridiales bacterium]|nr:glycine--tRNA ligase [Clostridiales bacterium]